MNSLQYDLTLISILLWPYSFNLQTGVKGAKPTLVYSRVDVVVVKEAVHVGQVLVGRLRGYQPLQGPKDLFVGDPHEFRVSVVEISQEQVPPAGHPRVFSLNLGEILVTVHVCD